MNNRDPFYPELVFTVRPSNAGVLRDPTGEWGTLGEMGMSLDCVCGRSENGTTTEIGELLRGHILWHRRGLRTGESGSDPLF